MIKLTRVYDWRQYLTAFINDRREHDFEWGKHDCALWAADCVKAITGKDFAAKIRGTYTTPLGAIKGLKKYYKADNLKQVFDERFEQKHIAFARPGDVVYKNSNLFGFNCIVGICYGQHSFFVNEDEHRLVELETLDLDGCWSIG